MSKSDDTITVLASVPPWSDAAKSWYLLTEQSPNKKGWSCGSWFPKKLCTLDLETGALTLPRWLYEKKLKERIKFTDYETKI